MLHCPGLITLSCTQTFYHPNNKQCIEFKRQGTNQKMGRQRVNQLFFALLALVIEACFSPVAVHGLLLPSISNVPKTRNLSHHKPTKQPFRTSHAAAPNVQSRCERRVFLMHGSSVVSHSDDAPKDSSKLNKFQSSLVRVSPCECAFILF